MFTPCDGELASSAIVNREEEKRRRRSFFFELQAFFNKQAEGPGGPVKGARRFCVQQQFVASS